MKFTNYLEKIVHVDIYPVISLLLFVIFFVAVTIWAYRINKNEIDRLSNLPLEDNH